jgi:hypothetical protein
MSRRSDRCLIRQRRCQSASSAAACHRALSNFFAAPSFWGAACITRRDGQYRFAGEPFDSRDVYVKGHKYRRYIFVWNVCSRWIVATDQGGRALRSAIFVYHLRKEGKTATLINKRIGFTSYVCGGATKLIAPVFVPAQRGRDRTPSCSAQPRQV